jgi:hypothetical protein
VLRNERILIRYTFCGKYLSAVPGDDLKVAKTCVG